MPRQTRGTRMKKSWFTSDLGDQVAQTVTQALIASITLTEGVIAEPTLLRTRGGILVTTVGDAAADSDMLGLGLMLIPSTTAVVGGASLPGPIVDAGADFWIWHNFVPLAQVVGTVAVAQSITAQVRIELDAKAMRRWPSDTTLALIGELSTGDFASVSVSARFRALTGV